MTPSKSDHSWLHLGYLALRISWSLFVWNKSVFLTVLADFLIQICYYFQSILSLIKLSLFFLWQQWTGSSCCVLFLTWITSMAANHAKSSVGARIGLRCQHGYFELILQFRGGSNERVSWPKLSQVLLKIRTVWQYLKRLTMLLDLAIYSRYGFWLVVIYGRYAYALLTDIFAMTWALGTQVFVSRTAKVQGIQELIHYIWPDWL